MPPKSLYTWGSNASGLLGLGDFEDRKQPERVTLFNLDKTTLINNVEIQVLKSGGCNAIVISKEHGIYVAGENKYGLLGLNSNDDKLKIATFIQIKSLLVHKIQKVSCGWWHTIVLGENGHSLFGWGWNKFGQLGIKTLDKTNKIVKPVKILIDTNAEHKNQYEDICCGWKHSILLINNGSVYSCGSNANGQLGRKLIGKDDNQCCYTFSKVFFDNVYPAYDAKHLVFHGLKVSCGWAHSSVLGYWRNNDGETRIEYNTVCTWGSNNFFQLGRQTKTDIASMKKTNIVNNNNFEPGEVTELNRCNIISIESGWSHMLALSRDRYVYSWGRDDFGQCGINKNKEKNNEHNKNLSRHKYCGINRIAALKSIKQISCGSEHSAAIDIDGQLYTWGWNEHFNLGYALDNKCSQHQIFSAVPTLVATEKGKIENVECGGATTMIMMHDEQRNKKD